MLKKLSTSVLYAMAEAGFVNMTNLPVWDRETYGKKHQTSEEWAKFQIQAHANDLGTYGQTHHELDSAHYFIITTDGQVWLASVIGMRLNEEKLIALAKSLGLRLKNPHATTLPSSLDVIEHCYILERVRDPYFSLLSISAKPVIVHDNPTSPTDKTKVTA